MRNDIRNRITELEDTLISIAGLDEELTNELLDEYCINVWALKSVDDTWIWEQTIRLQEIVDTIETRMPRISDKIFEEYIMYLNLLAICFYNIPKLRKLEVRSVGD